MKVEEISLLLDDGALGESIQELVRDLKATQHGDRTNPLYNALEDYHVEGGVWKHTTLAIEALPEVAQRLSEELDDPSYLQTFENNLHTLRAAALYHDIGKIVTQIPSKKRPGSYSFPGHSKRDVVKKLFDVYSVHPSDTVVDLVSHHHDSPDDVVKLEDNWDPDKVRMLMLVKAADNMAVGPRPIDNAMKHILSFMDAMHQDSEE